jgi:tetrahydromethanopterin S-methyltransferase subunit B
VTAEAWLGVYGIAVGCISVALVALTVVIIYGAKVRDDALG